MDYNKDLGKKGEDLASDYLQKKGYKVIEKNFKARYGEIDIIVRDRSDTLVFVEVKTRVGDLYGEPVEAILPRKLHEVIKTAEFYLLKDNLDVDWRIDVVAVSLKEDQTIEEIEHFENVTM